MARGPTRSKLSMSVGDAPKFDGTMLLADLGSSGLRQFGGYVREEFIPNLVGRAGATVYREMLDNSPIVGAVMFAILGVMRKVEWRVEPADDTPAAAEAAEFADSLRHDMSHTFEDFVTEALSMLGYGYSFHEICYKRRVGPKRFNSPFPGSKFSDGMIGWRKLPIRSQDTVLKWFFDENGEILGLTQQPWFGPLVDIPLEKALLFRPTQHKNNPEGRSIIRNSYRPYWFVKRLEEGEAIYIERMAGNVIVRVPTALLDKASGAAPDPAAVATLNAYKRIATRSRTDEQMGLLLPSDTFQGANGTPGSVPMFSYEYVTPQGGSGKNTDANVPIIRHKMDIMMSVLADFIQMGQTNRGAQNLADTKVDLFLNAVEGWLNGVASVINNHGLTRIWALNGLNRDLMPQFVPDMAQQVDLDVLSNFILRLSQAGVQMFPDHELEEYIRDAAGWPAAAGGVEWDAKEDMAEGQAPTDAAKAISRAVLAKQLKRRRKDAKF